MSLSNSRAGYYLLRKLILMMVRWKRIYISRYRSKEKLMAKYGAKFNHIQHADVISIGGDCMLAFNLSYWGLLKHNFGLEYVITENIATVTKLINNQFSNFFSMNHLKYCPESDSVLETFYDVYSVHDYKLKHHFMQEHEAVLMKFERRIQRFKRALTDSNRIVLLRYNLPSVLNEEITDLLGALNNNYPGLSVYL